ncbi:hypothetical protein GF389_02725 [Candidatus Dojkabacteria bacterium]|nr:hypothetical protein [Candidatus Dojkabacteria bacterium]
MKIFFGCSTSQMDTYKDLYLKIREIIIDEGHILTRDWLPLAIRALRQKEKAYNTKSAYRDIMKAINDADLLIIDDTASGFSTGHEITLGIFRQKPTLVLWHESKKRMFERRMIHGIDSPYLVTAYYTEKNLGEIILKFIKQFSNATKKHRFHLVIDEVERNYIDWAKFSQGKSRTKVIREAIREKIETDKNYQDYLGEIE